VSTSPPPPLPQGIGDRRRLEIRPPRAAKPQCHGSSGSDAHASSGSGNHGRGGGGGGSSGSTGGVRPGPELSERVQQVWRWCQMEGDALGQYSKGEVHEALTGPAAALPADLAALIEKRCARHHRHVCVQFSRPSCSFVGMVMQQLTKHIFSSRMTDISRAPKRQQCMMQHHVMLGADAGRPDAVCFWLCSRATKPLRCTCCALRLHPQSWAGCVTKSLGVTLHTLQPIMACVACYCTC
jgi:hypothetical protein